MLEGQIEELNTKFNELKSQIENYQPVSISGLKSPPEPIVEYRPFEQMMNPAKLTEVTKEFNQA